MPGKIFVNYRRDDGASQAARLRDRLAGVFGAGNVFMDVDNLLAGQRFDKELEKALVQTDVFLAVIGPRWLDILHQRHAARERDYVREEIAAALARGLIVVPVLVDRAVLPRGDDLPKDMRALVLHQKHDVSHERFGRDVEELTAAIRAGRKALQVEGRSGSIGAPRVLIGAAVAVLLLGIAGAYYAGMPLPWLGSQAQAPSVGMAQSAKEQQRIAALEAGTRQEEEARTRAEAEIKRLADIAAQAKRDADARQKVDAEAAAKRKAEDAARRLPKPGDVIRDCSDSCPEMVVVPAGSFTMGSNENDSEKPPHTVTIRQPFAVGKFEVTFAEWEACVAGGGCTSNTAPSDQGWGKGRRPVINVSWSDAKEYAAWLSRKTGKTYRLLSEAEWEYAARAGTTTKYVFGDTITKRQAQFSEGDYGSAKQTVEVGTFPANAS